MTDDYTILGDDGRLHKPGCPHVADDESDEVLDDCGECSCDSIPSPSECEA